MNEPWALNILYTIIKPFLTQKMRERVRCMNLKVECVHVFVCVGENGVGCRHLCKSVSVSVHSYLTAFDCFLPSQVHFLGTDMSPLHEEMDPSQLPSDLGGTLPPFSTDYTIRLLQDRGRDVDPDGEPRSEVRLQHYAHVL